MELITAKQVRQILGCSLPMVYKMAARGQIPCVRIPCPGDGTTKSKSLVRFNKEDILTFIERHYHAAM